MNSRVTCHLLAIALLVLISISAEGQERLRFGSSLKTPPHQALPFLAAEEQGLWKSQGLEVEWVAFGGGTELMRAVAAASISLAFTMADSVVQAASRGIPVKITADMGTRNDFYVWVLTGSRLKEPRDLEGARLGVPFLGSVSHAFGKVLSRQLGLAGKTKMVGAGGIGAAMAGMKAGALDAVLLTHFAMAPLRFKGEVRGLVSVREYLPKKWMDNVLLGRTDFMQKEPQTVKKGVKAIILAARFVMNNRQWSLERMKSFSGYSDEAAKGMYPFLVYSKDGRIDPLALENVVQFLVEYGLIPKDKALPVEQLYTNESLG